MNFTLKLKGNELRVVCVGVLHLAGMTRSHITEKCTVKLHWVTEYGEGR